MRDIRADDGGWAVATHETLDLRGFAAPEPLIRALDAADALQPGATLELFTPMLPVPLIEALCERGLRASAQRLSDGSARVLVRCAPGGAGHGEAEH